MKKNIEIFQLKKVLLKDIAIISTTSPFKSEMENTPIYRISKKDRNIVVIDSFLLIEHLNKVYENIDIQLIGPTHTIIRVIRPKKQKKILYVSFVWLLLFIGSAMTIMNFHYDVSMQQVQQKLHYLLTGEKSKYPLWIQIPYSLGLGIGMLLFLNHWFNKKFNEEPSPLEIELFNYQQNIDEYISHYENKIND